MLLCLQDIIKNFQVEANSSMKFENSNQMEAKFIFKKKFIQLGIVQGIFCRINGIKI